MQEKIIEQNKRGIIVYIGYLDDRKSLGYPALKDTRCGIKLVFINDSVKSKSKRIMVVICLEMF